MSNGKVVCKKCKNSVVPRLWHQDVRSDFFLETIKHICPLCGKGMYKTGGGFSVKGALIYLVIGGFSSLPAAEVLMINGYETSSAYNLSGFVLVTVFLMPFVFRFKRSINAKKLVMQ